MIKHVIEYINQRVTADKKYGLCELVRDGEKRYPAEYLHNDEYKKVELLSTIYHRANGNIIIDETEESDVACEMLVTQTYPLRLIFHIPKESVQDNQYSDGKIAQNIINAITVSNSQTLSSTLKAHNVAINVTGYNTDRYDVWDDEYENVDFDAHFKYAYGVVEYEVVITAEQSCFDDYDCSGDVDFNPCGDCYVTITDGDTVLKKAGGESYTCTGGDCDPVTVLDQDGGTVTTVAAGGTYNVIVFSGINDTGPVYSNSIIDNS